MTDVSIEYAHIYTNQKIEQEHRLSLEVLANLRNKLDQEDKTYNLVIMIDDYSFPDPSFNYEEFTEWLAKHDHNPDLVIRESQLIPVCDEVIRHVKDAKLKEQLIDYIKAKKYPCSLFIAAWYLLRLGYLQSPLLDPSLQASSLINILPASFKPFEDKGLEIIKSTPFSNAASKINYEFFEGRLAF